MKANRAAPRRKSATNPSITEAARRAQIIDAAITVIATEGFGQATFARIAREAGLSSTGLISYHFAGKQDLTTAIAGSIIGDLSRFMTEWMEVRSISPHAALVAYIEGLIHYMRTEGPRMRSLTSIVLHGGLAWDGEAQEASEEGVTRILRWGQETGDFRPFDIAVMANTIQRSLDGIPFLQMENPDLDLTHYAAELIDLFTHATSATAHV